jgi:hypothetical protein
MKKVKRLVVANGKYNDGAGQEKTRWLTIGSMLKKDDGQFKLKIDSIPVGSEFDGWVNLFDVDDEGGQQRPAAAPAGQVPVQDDDLPF